MQFITDIGKAATLHPQVKQSSNRIDNAVVQRKGNTKNDDEAETHCETTFSLRFDQYAMRIAEAIGVLIAKMHNANVIHGDLTTSNIMLSNFPQSLTHSLEQQSSQVPTKDSDKDDEIVENMENNDVGETMWVPKLTVIDFGLAGTAGSRGVNSEEMAVDLYVLERAFLSTHPGTESTVAEIMRSYKKNCTASDAVLARLFSVRQRGRKRECFG